MGKSEHQETQPPSKPIPPVQLTAPEVTQGYGRWARWAKTSRLRILPGLLNFVVPARRKNKKTLKKHTSFRWFWIFLEFVNLSISNSIQSVQTLASLPALEETKEAKDSYSFQMSGRKKARSLLQTEKHQYHHFPLRNCVSLLHLKMVHTSIHALWISPHLQHCRVSHPGPAAPWPRYEGLLPKHSPFQWLKCQNMIARKLLRLDAKKVTAK